MRWPRLVRWAFLLSVAWVLGACPGGRDERARQLDARLRATAAIIHTVPLWNRGSEARYPLSRLAALSRPGVSGGHRPALAEPVLSLSADALRGPTGSQCGFREDSPRRCRAVGALSDFLRQALSGPRQMGKDGKGHRPVTVLVEADTPTAFFLLFHETLLGLGENRVDLVFRRAQPPKINRARPSPSLAAAIANHSQGPLGGFTYPNFIFRNCPIDWAPVATAPPGDVRLELKRRKMVEAYGGWRCQADPGDMEWLFQLDLPEVFVHVVSFLTTESSTLVFLEPHRRWDESVVKISESMGAPPEGSPKRPISAHFAAAGSVGRFQLTEVRGPRTAAQLEFLDGLGKWLPKCVSRPVGDAPGAGIWQLEAEISGDGSIRIKQVGSMGENDEKLRVCLAGHLDVFAAFYPLAKEAAGTTSVRGELGLLP